MVASRNSPQKRLGGCLPDVSFLRMHRQKEVALEEVKGDLLSSPECPISGSGAGPDPSELTAWTLISNGVYVPAFWTEKGGDLTSAEFQRASRLPASRQDTLYWKS